MSAAPATEASVTDRIRDALQLVIDPELGYNIVDLGLVYEIDVAEGGVANVTMTTTTRGCPATDYLKNGALEAVWSVSGIEFADVKLTYDPPWTPHMMSAEAKEYLGIADSGGW
jgi:metal-sulfur cluster biosynthetic enzyme